MLYRIMTHQESSVWGLIFILSIVLEYLFSKIIGKRISNRVKENISKIFIVIGIILIAICFVLGAYISYKYHVKSDDIYLTNIIGIMGMIISFFGASFTMFGSLEKNKPKRYKLKQDNYLDYSNYVKTRVFLYNYELVIENKVAKFYKRIDKKKIYYIVDVKTDELEEETFEDFYYENILLEIEEDYELMKNKGYYLYITMVISVERITPMFYKYVNSENVDERYYKYPVGVSFGSNQIYIAGEDGFKPNYCKKQKKEIKEILEIEDKKESN